MSRFLLSLVFCALLSTPILAQATEANIPWPDSVIGVTEGGVEIALSQKTNYDQACDGTQKRSRVQKGKKKKVGKKNKAKKACDGTPLTEGSKKGSCCGDGEGCAPTCTGPCNPQAQARSGWFMGD